MPHPTPSLDDLVAIQAITAVIHRCARALDRLDRMLLLSCFHPDATDDHAPFFHGSAVAFVEWVLPALASMEATRHIVTNISVERDGTTAGTETYWSATLRVSKGGAVLHRGGRYLDRFACREGGWAILHRQSITEWSRSTPEAEQELAPSAIPRETRDLPMVYAARDRSDPSYRVLSNAIGPGRDT